MEIWIIGGALVALMVFLSTRIKRLATEAYSEELVEREGFALIKPEGLIVLENPTADFVFEAESKGFGENEATETIREASATVAFKSGDIAKSMESLLQIPGVTVVSQSASDCSIRFKESAEKAIVHVFKRQMALEGGRFLELTVRVLDESLDEFEETAKTMVRSLREN
jgi:hypothetical protein